MTYVIEKNIPYEKQKNNSYPFEQMEVGDSFFIKCEREKLQTASSYFGKRNGKKFSLRKADDGFRIWRIA